jgi:hypothetical protein
MSNLVTPIGLGRAAARAALCALVVVVWGGAAHAAAQAGRVTAERENFRATPQGTVLAEILRGTELRLGPAQDRWREVTLEGWIWSGSVRAENRDGHDLIVSAGGGENLRAAPNGEIIARLRTGMLLDRVGAEGGWVRVRRTAWVWQPSLQVDASAAGSSAGRPPPPPSATPTREFVTAGSRGLTVLTQPAGDTLARMQRGATVEVLAREGEWARVRVEGWTFTAAIAGEDAGGAVLRTLTRTELDRDPARYRGRMVEWSLQFIALQKAERFRTDFIEGEPFILARGPGDDAGFVYVAVPPERLDEVRALAPLQRIRVLARIRTPRSALTDAPVVDLLEIVGRETGTRR